MSKIKDLMIDQTNLFEPTRKILFDNNYLSEIKRIFPFCHKEFIRLDPDTLIERVIIDNRLIFDYQFKKLIEIIQLVNNPDTRKYFIQFIDNKFIIHPNIKD